VLEEIREKLKGGSKAGVTELTSRFYTVIPHDFGRKVPPVIADLEGVQNKIDLLQTLGDIEIAQSALQEQDASQEGRAEVEHPLDQHYRLLNADLEHVDPNSPEFKYCAKFMASTMGGNNLKLLDLFRVNRHDEPARFKEHDHIAHRKLLWHGTNVAVVVAILKTGLRIMPHSGGRVGKGIYFASENMKSAGYVRTAQKTGIMFLNEVALGKEHSITQDDSSLTAPPKGFDSIVARGHTEPDPKEDIKVTIDGHDVIVPQGKAITQSQYSSSSFWQSEYLVYKESQCRIRYLLKIAWPY